MTPKTTPAKGRKLPWTMTKIPDYVDVSEIKIETTPIPTKRRFNNKYDALFDQMKMGQNLRCKPEDVECVSQAMRKFIRQTKIEAHVISEKQAKDGYGRVWLVKGLRQVKKALH